ALEGDAAIEDLRARRDHHVRVERAVHPGARAGTAAVRLARHHRLPRLPRDVPRLSRRDPYGRAARDEPRARDGRPAAHGPGVRIAVTHAYDIVTIGSGAGGGTIAHALASSGARLLIVERGDFVPQEDANWSPEAVWRDLRYRAKETWLDERGREFNPYTHYNVGGNTKFWGSVLYRLRREDFQEVAHTDGVSPAWPIDYETLSPHYARGAQLYQVRGGVADDRADPPRGPYPFPAVPHAAGMARIAERLREQGLHPSPLPLGLLNVGDPDGCRLCNTCNSFACRIHAKSDADVIAVRPATARSNVTLWTGAHARRLIADPSGATVEAVEVERNGAVERVTASTFVVSCGAVNSAALLLRSASDKHPKGLANSSDLVGRRYMAHLATMLEGV